MPGKARINPEPLPRVNVRHTVTLTPNAEKYVRKVYGEIAREATKTGGRFPTFSAAISRIVEEHAAAAS